MHTTIAVKELVPRAVRLYARAEGDLVVVETRSERGPDYKRRFRPEDAVALARCLDRDLLEAKVTADSGEEYVACLERTGMIVIYELVNSADRIRRMSLDENKAMALALALKAAVVKAMEGER